MRPTHFVSIGQDMALSDVSHDTLAPIHSTKQGVLLLQDEHLYIHYLEHETCLQCLVCAFASI